MPERLGDPLERIALEAAINEVCTIPLAIVNLTGQVAEYQILLCTDRLGRADEQQGLKSDTAEFPMDKIECLRAIRVKDSDEAGTSVRFDPLVELDRSRTLAASGRDSALFYYRFDCHNADPGIYRGFLHVIPLSEPSLTTKGPLSLPQVQSIPFELTVFPFALSEELRTPLWYFGNAKDQKVIERMLDEGITHFPVSSWGARLTFDDEGNIVEKDISIMVTNITQQRQWASKRRPGVKVTHVVIYSLYHIFMDRFGKDRFEVGSPEWRSAFRNWVKLIVEARDAAGVAASDFVVEVEDEPAHTKASAPLTVILEASKMVREAAPDLKTMLTVGSSLKAGDLYL